MADNPQDRIPATPPVIVTTTPYQMSPNTVYIVNMSSKCTLMLPTTAEIGSTISVVNKGTDIWRIAQNAGQSIVGADTTTVGVSGYIESQTSGDSVFLRCVTADTVFKITNKQGTLTLN